MHRSAANLGIIFRTAPLGPRTCPRNGRFAQLRRWQKSTSEIAECRTLHAGIANANEARPVGDFPSVAGPLPHHEVSEAGRFYHGIQYRVAQPVGWLELCKVHAAGSLTVAWSWTSTRATSTSCARVPSDSERSAKNDATDRDQIWLVISLHGSIAAGSRAGRAAWRVVGTGS